MKDNEYFIRRWIGVELCFGLNTVGDAPILPMPVRLYLCLFLWIGCLAGLPSTAAATGLATSPQSSVLLCGGSMMNGNEFKETVHAVLRNHYVGCRRVVLVLHASHPTERDAMEARLRTAFVQLLGDRVIVESLHRQDAEGAKALLRVADALFVGGGETFVLLSELQRTGQLEVIRERVLAGVPYGGSSAGANVAGLRIGATNDFPVADIVSRTAIGIFPAVINPHHPMPVPATKGDFDARVGKIKGYLKFNSDEHVLALADAATARFHAGRVTVTGGTAWHYTAAGVRSLSVGDEVSGLTP